MTGLKCPFCNKKLEPIGTSGQFQCGTWGCDASFNFYATRDVWEYIERTKKKLDIAVDALKRVRKCHNYTTDEGFVAYEALYKLGEIKPINQKDTK